MTESAIDDGAEGFPLPGELPPRRRIFTNRNLRMESIAAIGFDMDHTLAVYNVENFSRLCFDMALERLVRDRDYPSSILDVPWLPDASIRGLVVDKKLGNLLKIDGHGHITRARHGSQFLDRDQRRGSYPRGRTRIGTPRYRVFDTLFDLPEGSLYTTLVDQVARGELTLHVSFRRLYDDIRDTVDTLHADGTLKARITADLGSYFIHDPDLVPTLERFRAAGKRLFLLTNSEVEYTGAVMQHLVGGAPGAWEGLFDLIVCAAGKPAFFLERGPGRAVEPGQYPLLPSLGRNAYVGGDCFFLEGLLEASGDGILYFGDHTYGDILRSKKSVGWRTAMIVPEIETEVAKLTPLRSAWQELNELEEHLEDLVTARDLARDQLRDPARADDAALAEALARLERRLGEALGRRARLQRLLRAAFNPHWESLFREGRAASRFGRQVMEFACIYTSRVSNFLGYPADKFFSRPLEVLPHERWALPET
jgi:HAD superfamily 5'-nucleotidase-like hydrolase